MGSCLHLISVTKSSHFLLKNPKNPKIYNLYFSIFEKIRVIAHEYILTSSPSFLWQAFTVLIHWNTKVYKEILKCSIFCVFVYSKVLNWKFNCLTNLVLKKCGLVASLAEKRPNPNYPGFFGTGLFLNMAILRKYTNPYIFLKHSLLQAKSVLKITWRPYFSNFKFQNKLHSVMIMSTSIFIFSKLI